MYGASGDNGTSGEGLTSSSTESVLTLGNPDPNNGGDGQISLTIGSGFELGTPDSNNESTTEGLYSDSEPDFPSLSLSISSPETEAPVNSGVALDSE